jgi:hypothetical protein
MKNSVSIAAILICVSCAASANASHPSGQEFTINGPYEPTTGSGDDKRTRDEQYYVDTAACQKQQRKTPGICTLQYPPGSGARRKGPKTHLVCRPGGMPAYHKCIHEATVEYLKPYPDS